MKTMGQESEALADIQRKRDLKAAEQDKRECRQTLLNILWCIGSDIFKDIPIHLDRLRSLVQRDVEFYNDFLAAFSWLVEYCRVQKEELTALLDAETDPNAGFFDEAEIGCGEIREEYLELNLIALDIYKQLGCPTTLNFQYAVELNAKFKDKLNAINELRKGRPEKPEKDEIYHFPLRPLNQEALSRWETEKEIKDGLQLLGIEKGNRKYHSPDLHA